MRDSTQRRGYFPEDLPIASRIDRAPPLVLEQDGICELMLECRVRHAPILD